MLKRLVAAIPDFRRRDPFAAARRKSASFYESYYTEPGRSSQAESSISFGRNRCARPTWAFSPVTKKVESKKHYSRKRKAHDRYDDCGMGFFCGVIDIP